MTSFILIKNVFLYSVFRIWYRFINQSASRNKSVHVIVCNYLTFVNAHVNNVTVNRQQNASYFRIKCCLKHLKFKIYALHQSFK